MSDARSQKFLVIQVLRIVAACLVVFTHSTFYTHERLDRTMAVWQRGTRGVDVFFVISGFVMILSSQRLLGLADSGRVFLQHRLIRIVPLYWLVTSVKVAILLLTAGFALHSVLTPATVVCSYLFIPARDLDGKIEPLVGVGWTLNFEMLFYYLFAAALFLRRDALKFVGIALAVMSAGAYFRGPSWPPISAFLNPIVLEFFFGMLIATVCMKGAYFPKALALLLTACGFAALVLPPDALWGWPKVLVSGVPAALIVWSVASLRDAVDSVPSWILYLGEASYSIYLIHPFVAPLPPALMHRLHIDRPWLSVGLGVALGLGAGAVLHSFVEIPLTNLVKRYTSDRRRPVRAAT